MAGFNKELPYDLIKEINNLDNSVPEMLGNMTRAGAEIVFKNVKSNMKKSFKSTKSLEKGLKITKVYHNSNDEIVTKIGFYGYDSDKKTGKYPNGVPIPLIALAREHGTSRGEQAKPFFKKSFNKAEIERSMLEVQEKYLPKE